jgi:nucleotide-binding universal stress UspA family protein
MRDILVHAANFRAWSGGVEFAARLAASLDALLTGAYIYPSPLYTMPPYGSPGLLAAILENARELEESARAAEKSFASWTAAFGATRSAWQVAEGYLPDTLAHIANWNDLVVLQRDPAEPWGGPLDLGTLVLHVDAPCIVVPPKVTQPRLGCIALAWNGSPEAIRAIHAALPLLQRAERVVLFSGERREPFVEIGWKPPFDIAVHLARHAIEVERNEIFARDERAGEALLEAAAKVGADLLVMGAYGRTRFSEWIFGGATRHVLHEATLPVLLRH